MPTYEFYCRVCNYSEDFLLKIAERDKDINCWKCGGPMERRISPVMGRVYGSAYNKKNDTVNRATAALLDIPYRELPSGLRTEIEE